MPQVYPNCNWPVLPDWHGLNFDSALLTKVNWNYATHIVRVCFFPKNPIVPNLHVNKKGNLQVHFVSKAMASLYKILYNHSLT